MDLQPIKTVTTPLDEKAWLGSKHGVDSDRSITLDLDLFRANGQVDANGYVPSGTDVVKGGNGLYGPARTVAGGVWTGAKADGHLFESVKANPASTRAGGSIHWHGVVVAAQVPAPAAVGGVAAPAFDVADGADHILYV